MLHLVTTIAVLDALPGGRISQGDDIVLQGSAVSAARRGHRQNSVLTALVDDRCGLHAMADRLQAFGIAPSAMLAGVAAIDYDALVELTVKHPLIHTWA
ncbi:MAG: hypothetical protein KGZ80_04060 [Methylomonas sp.]|nr:hypothetical protein [Methylomonas sp.]PPD20781.1 MAG: hypothetical protein CTY23_07535 [Methylomonas sp.]PPD27296.1 MAG: hypothetical protein CTY22_02425 [Methylomonas sp.]PPD39267.1 MAG: hypothetical protein CTY21_02420 [Methylomonas sp.]PPD40735.1 MAG: hypothetical protein CTY17_05545 [Methylomonas sp.]